MDGNWRNLPDRQVPDLGSVLKPFGLRFQNLRLPNSLAARLNSTEFGRCRFMEG